MAFLWAGRGEGPGFGGGNDRALNVPPAVFALIGALVAAHVARILLPASLGETLLRGLAFVPANLLHPPGGWLTVSSWASPVMHLFLHADASDLAMECLLLLIFGTSAARRFGGVGFLVLFFAGGIAGALLYLLTAWNSPAGIVGASGGISAVTLAAIRATWMSRTPPATLPPPLAPILSTQVLVFAIFWIGANFLFGHTAVLPSGAVAIQLWQPAAAGAVFGILAAGVLDRFVPKIDLSAVPGP